MVGPPEAGGTFGVALDGLHPNAAFGTLGTGAKRPRSRGLPAASSSMPEMSMRVAAVVVSGLLTACGSGSGASPSDEAPDAASDAADARVDSSDGDSDAAVGDAEDVGSDDVADGDDDVVPSDAGVTDTAVDVPDTDGGDLDAGAGDVADRDAADVADAADTLGDSEVDAGDVGADTTELAPAVDIEGNVYPVVRIGDQVWMAENLRVTSFNDGTPITQWTFGESWFAGGATPQYQWANTEDLNNLHDEDLPHDYYGALYNEAALASGRLAPEGWRIPTPDDFAALEAFLISDGQEGNVVTALKATESWVPLFGNGTDLYGFRALANGYVAGGGTATGTQVIATFATDRVDLVELTRTVVNLHDTESLQMEANRIELGAGVRCIRDE